MTPYFLHQYVSDAHYTMGPKSFEIWMFKKYFSLILQILYRVKGKSTSKRLQSYEKHLRMPIIAKDGYFCWNLVEQENNLLLSSSMTYPYLKAEHSGAVGAQICVYF